MENKEIELYLRIIDQMPNPIWRAGLDTKCDYFNKSWLEFTGRTIDQEMGNGWAEGVHPDDFKKCLDTYLAAFNACKPFTMQYRLKHHDNTYHWLLDSGSPFFDNDKNFLGYIGSCYDIEEVEKSKNILKLTNSMAKVGGWEIDVVNNTLFWTEEVYKLHEVDDGYEPKLGEGIDFYVGESKEKIGTAVKEAMTIGKPFDMDLEIKTAKGNYLWVRSLGRALTENNKIVKIFGTFQDITDKKKYEMEIENKNHEMEASNKIMVNRELAMVKLKEKIAELEDKLSKK